MLNQNRYLKSDMTWRVRAPSERVRCGSIDRSVDEGPALQWRL